MSSPNNGYNPQQQALIDAPVTSPVIGVAGAGTGKTTTILARTERILEEYQTGNILLITFTRAAATDLRKRLEAELTAKREQEEFPFDADGNAMVPKPWATDIRRVMVGTFHSIISGYIRRHATEIGLEPNFSIIDENSTYIMFRNLVEASAEHQKELSAWALEPNEKKLMKKHYTLLSNTVSALINMARPEELMSGKFTEDTLYHLSKTHKSISEENVSQVAEFCYRLFKESIIDGQRTNTVTYDQVLFLGYLMVQGDLLKEEKESLIHTIVDEYQDTNLLQDTFIRYLSEGKLTIVGDMDQSIYEFRGGRPSLIMEHAKDASIYNLSYNYRSYQPILDAANRVIKHNETGGSIRADLQAVQKMDGNYGGITFTVSEIDKLESGQIVQFLKDYHNRGIAWSDMAILLRSRMTLPSISRALTEAHVPVNDTTKFADFMKSDVMVDTLNFLKVFVNPKDIYAFLGIIDRPKQGIGPAAIAKLQAYADKHHQGLVEYLLSANVKELTPALKKKVSNFMTTYGSIMENNENENVSLSILVGYIFEAFGYEKWLMGLKDKDRYRRDLITLKGMIRDFEEDYAKEHPKHTLYDLANEFVFNMSAVSSREEKKDGVCITTVHNAKGLEWDHVFLLGLEQENFPGNRLTDEEDLESERRLLYVAITRAKKSLHLFASQKRITSDKELSPSQFIEELEIPPTYALQREGV